MTMSNDLPDLNRRGVMLAAGLAAGAVTVASAGTAHAAPIHATTVPAGQAYPPGRPGVDYQPVVAPNATKIPFTVRDGVKIFHLTLGEYEHTFAQGLVARVWGFNQAAAGAMIEAVEGDRVRIYVTNRLGAPTAVHWHGFILPSGMDGVGGISQENIPSGETWVYEFPLVQHGTLMFHAHHDEMVQMGLGLTGMFIIHPRRPRARVDRDFALLLHEWKIRPGARRPDPNEMTDFNVFTLNGKVFPATDPLVVRQGQKVRIRFANLGMQNHHPMHIHGYSWKITETDGGVIPEAGRWPETTVLVPVGTTRTVEFDADYVGDWAMHCHMLHHLMNQMGHGAQNMVGVDTNAIQARTQDVLPEAMIMGRDGMDEHGQHVEMGHMPVPENSIPMVGVRGPRGYIPMGGLVTVIKVRAGITSFEDPGWFENPPGTEARKATPTELSRDGVTV
jgi:FtsP/CotA-like multicopper oxidase with cupredoxin domain